MLKKTEKMTDWELQNKIGSMDQRFLDDQDYYVKFVELLMHYYESSDNYGHAVTSALKDGLDNCERYLRMESALSPRSIVIEKRRVAKGMNISKADVEGNYRVFFILDDERKLKMRFDRKQSHLLYILILLCSLKNGLLPDFFLSEDNLDTVIQLIKLIYPQLGNKSARLMAKELAPDRSFSDIFQKMKSPLVDCLQQAEIADDLYWYMPYAVQREKKRLYRMHLPQPQIICPPEFLPIIDSLPDVSEFIPIDLEAEESDLENDFAWWKLAAEQGDAEGLYYLGVFYGTGDVVSQDYKVSRDYFELADQRGCFDATFQLGVYHMFGFGVKKDIHQALTFFERAAANGHAEAAAWAGHIYEQGIDGIKVDHLKAFNRYMIAAGQDNEEAIWYVIQGYLLGQGAEKDFGKAYEWFLKAKALGYERIKTLFGIHYFNQGDDESLDKALQLFNDGCNADIPQAFYFMGIMALKGYCKTNDVKSEVRKWFLEGAVRGDQMSIQALMKCFPVEYEKHHDSFEKRLSIRDIFIGLVRKMNNMVWDSFIQLVNAYRERWHENYLAEMCKQLNIHKKPDGNGNDWVPERRITIRKSKGGKIPYEMILSLANGDEVIIDKINLNCLTLFLLTIICSYKSGYSTMMAADKDCRPILRELVQLVNGSRISNPDDYIEGMMCFERDEEKKKNEDYYKQYSNMTKNVIKKAIGVRDDAYYFLFENVRTTGRKILRHINLDSQNIEIPQELMDLAVRMPDALDVVQHIVNQNIRE